MRKKGILCLVFPVMWFAACAIHKKPAYNIPDDIKGDQRKELLKALERGRKLYELHCAECHGIYSKGIDNAPNFSKQQIDNYSAWAIRKDPKNHAVAANMDAEQLHEVFMFLKARKMRHGQPTISDTTTSKP